jgi:hypothetical protein
MYSRFSSFMKYNHAAMAKKLQIFLSYTYTIQISKVFSYCEGTKNKVERNAIFILYFIPNKSAVFLSVFLTISLSAALVHNKALSIYNFINKNIFPQLINIFSLRNREQLSAEKVFNSLSMVLMKVAEKRIVRTWNKGKYLVWKL